MPTAVLDAPDGHLARQAARECVRRRLIVERGGPHASVVRFLPLLTVTAEQVETIADRFAEAVAAAERDPGASRGTPPA
ncbi:MAG: hypothetical protein GEU81_15240 [Nitriliruptorales bacterium]|nr:hypothetical protein [Nitriliruptorales bacterium]